MKTINIPLEDKDYQALIRVKGNRTWHEFIDDLIKTHHKKEKKGGKTNGKETK